MSDNLFEKFVWSEEYETGVDHIDRQHKELFKRIDDFTLSIYDGTGRSKLNKMMEFLEEYIETHFEDEEELMLLSNYPDFHNHVKMHKKFTVDFNLLQKDFENRGEDTFFAIRLEKEVRNWLEKHVLNVDMEYIPFIKNVKKKPE